MQAAIGRAALDPGTSGPGSTGILRARGCAVVLPSRGAAEALRRTLENLSLTDASPAVLLPDLLTRSELYQGLSLGLGGAPARLTDFEREVIFRRAAEDAAEGGAPAPFRLRPGLVVEILAFYDELRRRDRTVEAFERLMIGALEGSAGIDRGAERLLRLPAFSRRRSISSKRACATPGGWTSTGSDSASSRPRPAVRIRRITTSS